MTRLVDQPIGPCTILRKLGRGRLGVVYLGRDSRLDRDVAIRALREHLAQDLGRAHVEFRLPPE